MCRFVAADRPRFRGSGPGVRRAAPGPTPGQAQGIRWPCCCRAAGIRVCSTTRADLPHAERLASVRLWVCCFRGVPGGSWRGESPRLRTGHGGVLDDASGNERYPADDGGTRRCAGHPWPIAWSGLPAPHFAVAPRRSVVDAARVVDRRDDRLTGGGVRGVGAEAGRGVQDRGEGARLDRRQDPE